MHNVFKGIVVGFIGFTLWIAFSVFEGINELVGETSALGLAGMVGGFSLMVLGPVTYIIVVPVVGWVRRRRAEGR